MSAQPIEDDEKRDARLARRRALRLGRRTRPITPSMDWQLDAACQSVPATVSDAMTDATHQSDATELAEVWCAGCPVRAQCLEAGMATGGYGLWGGVVLVQGRKAPRDRHAALKVVPDPMPATPAAEPAPAGGQRWQPRRLPRAKRRATPNRGKAETICHRCYMTACDCG